MTETSLIVNADDFGRSPGVNEGVIRAHEDGIVTSATLMVRWPDAEAAGLYARQEGALSVGLHLDLGEWEYRDGAWHAHYEVLASATPHEVLDEVDRQLGRFEQLVGRPPSHLDSHQHVHRDEPAQTALRRAGERLGVPVRDFTPGIAYSGVFYGQDAQGRPVPEAITVDALVRAIEMLPAGITEFGCHPATVADHPSTYDHERVTEFATLRDPRVRAAIERCGVTLRSFADLDTVPRT